MVALSRLCDSRGHSAPASGSGALAALLDCGGFVHRGARASAAARIRYMVADRGRFGCGEDAAGESTDRMYLYGVANDAAARPVYIRFISGDQDDPQPTSSCHAHPDLGAALLAALQGGAGIREPHEPGVVAD